MGQHAFTEPDRQWVPPTRNPWVAGLITGSLVALAFVLLVVAVIQLWPS